MWFSLQESYASTRTIPSLDQTFWFNEYVRLEEIYRSQWDINHLPCFSLPMDDAAMLTWRDARYALPSYIDMWQWSGDQIWLDRFVERSDYILSLRTDHNGDGLWGWYTQRSPEGEHIVLDMAIAWTMVRFSNIAGHLYPDEAEEYRSVGEYISSKWFPSWTGKTYASDIAGTIPNSELPYNMIAIAGLFHYELGHTRQVEAIADRLRGAMRQGENGGLIWNYAPYNSTRIEDINHAGGVVSFAVVAMPDVLDGLRTTMSGVWRGGGEFSWWINGQRTLLAPDMPYFRHMELGSSLYAPVAASWLYLLDKEDAVCRSGRYLSVPSLILLHQFPQKRIWLPIAMK